MLITGAEPDHWHALGADGALRHAMKDPRTLPAYHRTYWTADERAYVDHLDAHHAATTDPRRTNDDPPLVEALFDAIDSNERKNATYRSVIVAVRHALADGASLDDVRHWIDVGTEQEGHQR
ncbi:hypothetical protein IL38_24055 [Actinopolyspora erythraea]|uniref:Uncharacterized protein n=1 Tax=Actinopolyspora erythraea TaxID=414996 RepID=A0ABR4WYB6_9ACTN|nr:hypothetical protein [Actinopolyspora erythraea]KGI79374.1 hypothetical protein IL38_24055 [Actinopolyspora erythraea]